MELAIKASWGELNLAPSFANIVGGPE